MKYGKFLRILAEHPSLEGYIPANLPPLPLALSAQEHERQLEDWVRDELEFVAFRPFAQLDLTASAEHHEERVPHPRIYSVTCSRAESTNYVVSYAREEEGEVLDGAMNAIDCTVANVITKLVDKHSPRCEVGGSRLRFDRVVKHYTYYDEGTQTRRERIEVYLFPADFNPEQFRIEAAA